jgi:hypothetical protein
MMKLTMKTRPRNLTTQQMWELYVADTGVETSEFIVKVLDLCYPNRNREKMDVFSKMTKYREARVGYNGFLQLIKGMVGNG